MDYFTKNIRPFARSLVANYAKYDKFGVYTLEVDDLPETELNTFAKHCLEESGRDAEFIYDNDDLYNAFYKMLKDKTQESKIQFSEMMRNQLVNYYRNYMSRTLNTILQEMDYEDYLDSRRSA